MSVDPKACVRISAFNWVLPLSARCPNEGRPEADGTDAVPFPDGKKLVSKAG